MGPIFYEGVWSKKRKISAKIKSKDLDLKKPIFSKNQKSQGGDPTFHHRNPLLSLKIVDLTLMPLPKNHSKPSLAHIYHRNWLSISRIIETSTF